MSIKGQSTLIALDEEIMTSINKTMTPEQALALMIIKMSLKEYLFFCTGRNGISPEKFIEAYNYLFKLRSGNKNDQMYFDVNYNSTYLCNILDLKTFLEKLKQRRIQVIADNKSKVLSQVNIIREEEWASLKTLDKKITRDISESRAIDLLIQPDDMIMFAKLFCYDRITVTKSLYKKLLF